MCHLSAIQSECRLCTTCVIVCWPLRVSSSMFPEWLIISWLCVYVCVCVCVCVCNVRNTSVNMNDYLVKLFCWPCILIILVMKTNLMYKLSIIYFVKQPLPVLGVFIAHHQEVFTVYVQQWNKFHPDPTSCQSPKHITRSTRFTDFTYRTYPNRPSDEGARMVKGVESPHIKTLPELVPGSNHSTKSRRECDRRL